MKKKNNNIESKIKQHWQADSTRKKYCKKKEIEINKQKKHIDPLLSQVRVLGFHVHRDTEGQ